MKLRSSVLAKLTRKNQTWSDRGSEPRTTGLPLQDAPSGSLPWAGSCLQDYVEGKKTEVNLITSPPFFMAAFCAFACRLAGIPYVFDVRDRYPNVLFELKVLSREGWPGRMLLGLEKVICSSSFSSLRLRRAWSPICGELLMGEPLFLSSNGFAEKAFRDQLLSRPQFSRFTIVYHGRLGRFYDTETLCEVIEILEETNPEIRFLMIGELSAFRARKSWRNVEFMDEMPLRNWLRSCPVAMWEFVCSRKRMP